MVIFIIGCQIDEIPDIIGEKQLIIEEASSEDIAIFTEWILNAEPNTRVMVGNFNPSNLVRITNENRSRLAVINSTDVNTSLSFVIDSDQINRAFISNSTENLDKTITSRIYSIDNQFMLKVLHGPDGSLKRIDRGQTVIDYGWFAELDYCMGRVLSPFETNTANVAMDLAFSAATLGLWIPSVTLSCAGFGLARM